MTVGKRTYTVDATATTVSYEVGRSGRRLLSRREAPSCK